MKRYIVMFTTKEHPNWITAPEGCDGLYSYSYLDAAQERYDHSVGQGYSRNVWLYEQADGNDLADLRFVLRACHKAKPPRVVEYNKRKESVWKHN